MELEISAKYRVGCALPVREERRQHRSAQGGVTFKLGNAMGKFLFFSIFICMDGSGCRVIESLLLSLLT